MAFYINHDSEPAFTFAIIGRNNEDGTITTFGTGFFGKRNDSIYLITCEHVIENIPSDQIIFIPPGIKLLEGCADKVYPLSEPVFYSGLGESETYDVVVFKIPCEETNTIKGLKIAPYNLDNSIYASTLTYSNRLLTRGFSISYINNPKTKMFSRESNKLLPWQRSGFFEKCTFNEHNFANTNKTYLEVFYMRGASKYSIAGASGGVVVSPPTLEVTGVIFGQCSEYFFFADIKRVIEIIDHSD